MLLVIGATGTTGRHLLNRLAGTKSRVRAMVHTPDKAADIEDLVEETVVGDLSRPQTLEAAVAGVDHIYFAAPVGPQLPEWVHNVTRAVGSARPHVVRLSVLGADPHTTVRPLQWHGLADRELLRSGVPCTILRPHFFMQNFVGVFGRGIRQRSTIEAPMRDGQIVPLDVRDLGAVTVKTLLEPGHMGKSYALTGPNAFSFYDLAGHLSEAVGRQITYVDLSPDEALHNWTAALGGEAAAAIVELYDYFASGEASEPSDDVERITGNLPRGFVEFAQEHADYWR